ARVRVSRRGRRAAGAGASGSDRKALHAARSPDRSACHRPDEPPLGPSGGRHARGLRGGRGEGRAAGGGPAAAERGGARPSFARMVARADVLVESLPTPLLARWGCDYPSLSERNPRLVVVSVSC